MEKEISETLQELAEFLPKSLLNLKNEKNPELKKYSSETLGILKKTTQLIQKLLEKLAETH